ncbi:MAG: type II/IV secretion system protein [Parcubacteria group bacterium]|nr:type II/IV secretion system protein [Parcubacteria group bacterium]
MNQTEEKLKSVLTESGVVSREAWDEAVTEAARTHTDPTDILVARGIIAEHELGTLVADALGYPFVRLAETTIDEAVLMIIPEPMSRAQHAIAFARDRAGIKVATPHPDNFEMIRFLEKRTGERILPYYATPHDTEQAFSLYHRSGITFHEELDRLAQNAVSPQAKSEEQSVVELVDFIVRYGFENRASDIHIEPHETHTRIRLRIDGILHDVGELPLTLHERIIARIKVLGRMRLDEHASAQDGRLQMTFDRTHVDIRISIVPITKGEKAVLRLLSEQVQRFHLEDIGFSHADFERVRRNLTQPWGMILATGPTGSGKTTTLYAMLKILNQRGVNISTIEDPVEYDIEGVNQIQANPKTNLTFASGLRAIVRQNPDIIMVGEIRDSETAGIAINAALTGHLVLSTLHTNDAPTALPRLLDMHVEPFLIASSINLVIAQRLVRKICVRCIQSYTIDRAQLRRDHVNVAHVIEATYTGKGKIRLYRGEGCSTCGMTGYTGRMGIFEVLEADEKVRELVRAKSDADSLRAYARSAGMTTLLEDGVSKMLAGVTTLEEVIRVIREEEV